MDAASIAICSAVHEFNSSKMHVQTGGALRPCKSYSQIKSGFQHVQLPREISTNGHFCRRDVQIEQ